MIFILLCILSSTSLFVIFKLIDRFNLKTFDVIVINYFVASILGYSISDTGNLSLDILKSDWLLYAIIIGVLFILMFMVVGKSSQKVGIAITTVSGKMSVIIPIAFSILYDPNDHLSYAKTAGLILALIGVFLTIYRKRKIDFDPKNIYLPIILFIGMGVVDSFVKFAQHNFVSDDLSSIFTAMLFTISFLSGIIFKLLKGSGIKSLLRKETLLWGTLLGLGNYGSIYFIIRALNYIKADGNTMDGSIVFGINNIGVVGLSVVIGLLVFKEKLTRINWVGVILSFLAIIILARY